MATQSMLPMSTPDESKRRRPASAPLQLALLRLGVGPRGALAYVLLLLLLVLALLARCTLLCTAAGTSREAPCAAVAPRPGIAAHGALTADGGSGARAALAAASAPSVALPPVRAGTLAISCVSRSPLHARDQLCMRAHTYK